MRLRFLGKNSTPGASPTLYATDRDTYVVQGYKVTDPDVLAKLDPPGDETCVEVPAPLFERSFPLGAAGRSIGKLNHGSCNGGRLPGT